MSDQFLAEIRIFPFNFAPIQWALCNGQLLAISQNTALFSLIGTFYGGDGRSTFALPNLQGSVPVAAGQGPGLSQYFIGEQGGDANVTLLNAQNPSHNHLVNARDVDANSTTPAGNVYAKGTYAMGGSSAPLNMYTPTAPAPGLTLKAQTTGLAGGNQPHNNLMPSLTLNFCIAMQGIFPPRG